MAQITKKNTNTNANEKKGEKGKGGDKPKEKLSKRDRAVRDVERFASRLEKFGARVEKTFSAATEIAGSIKLSFSQATAQIRQVAMSLKTLPADWKPERGSAAHVLDEGDIVQVREKVADKYDGLLPKGANLKVLQVRKAIVAVQAPAGERVFLPRGHVILASLVKPATSA